MKQPNRKPAEKSPRETVSAPPAASEVSKRKPPPAKSDLDAIEPIPGAAAYAEEGIAASEREAAELDNDQKRFELNERLYHLNERQKYAQRTFKLVTGWIYIVLSILLLQGFGSSYRYFHFHLSDKVISVAIGSTTLNVIGMLIIVLKGIFPNQRK